MILSSSGAIAFEIFGFSAYWYGIVMAFAIFVGALVADWTYKKFYAVSSDDFSVLDFMPWLIFVGFIGARLYYCILNFGYYSQHPSAVFNVREGGLSIHGMIFAAVILLFFYCRKKNLKFFNISAPLCLGLALAQSIGRWGNFFNSEAFGLPFDGLVKLYIPVNLRPDKFAGFEYFHPTFLYESLLDFLIFVVLFFVVQKTNKSPLFITSLYFCLYSLARIVVESFRIDSVVFIMGIPIATCVSALLFIVGFCGIVKSEFFSR